MKIWYSELNHLFRLQKVSGSTFLLYLWLIINSWSDVSVSDLRRLVNRGFFPFGQATFYRALAVLKSLGYITEQNKMIRVKRFISHKEGYFWLDRKQFNFWFHEKCGRVANKIKLFFLWISRHGEKLVGKNIPRLAAKLQESYHAIYQALNSLIWNGWMFVTNKMFSILPLRKVSDLSKEELLKTESKVEIELEIEEESKNDCEFYQESLDSIVAKMPGLVFEEESFKSFDEDTQLIERNIVFKTFVRGMPAKVTFTIYSEPLEETHEEHLDKLISYTNRQLTYISWRKKVENTAKLIEYAKLSNEPKTLDDVIANLAISDNENSSEPNKQEIYKTIEEKKFKPNALKLLGI